MDSKVQNQLSARIESKLFSLYALLRIVTQIEDKNDFCLPSAITLVLCFHFDFNVFIIFLDT